MRFKLLNIIFLLMVMLTLAGCFHKSGDNSTTAKHKQIVLNDEQEKNAKLATDFVKIRDLDLEITIPAQFKAMHQSMDRIYSPIEGKVMNVFVDPGQIIKKGQALAQIKSDEIGQIQLEFLDRYINIDCEVKQWELNMSCQTRIIKGRKPFLKRISSRRNINGKAQVNKDKANYDSLRIQRSTLVKVYAQRLALYGADAGVINRALATKQIYPYVTLRANKNGILLERKVNPGEIVGQNKELFNLADLYKIWLVGYAFEKDATFLKVGEEINGTLEETKGKRVKGKLSYVSAMLDTESKTLEVRADVDNKDFYIKPNMYAQMFVNVGKVKRLSVPNNSLEVYGDYTFAYVKVKPNTYEERKVKIGQKNDEYSEVLEGLKDGEEVVTEGAFSLLGESIKQKKE
jgi:cobalt-zinc-cadmium efflux system membrane fusion protein